MRMKNVFLLTLCCLLVGCGLLGRKKIKEPDVELQSVDVVGATVGGANVNFNFLVKNPNAFALKVDGGEYKLESEDRLLADGKVGKGLEVAGNSQAVLTLPAVVRFQDLFRSVSSFLSKGTAPYRLHGRARLGIISLPFDEKGDFVFADGKLQIRGR